MILKHIIFPGISLSHVLTPAGRPEVFSMHTHTNAELLFFVRGKGVYHVEGNAYPLVPGDIFIMRPTEAHFVEPDPLQDYERIVLNFDPNIFAPFDSDGTLLKPFLDREAGKQNCYRALNFGSNAYQAYLHDMFKEDRLVLLANLILLLKEIGAVFETADRDGSHPNTVEYHMIRYINQNMHREVTVGELSERFFLSRAQLSLRFKKATGTSVGRYISIKRLMLARQRLRQGEKPTEVFAECGYQDYSTFYRAYVRLFGHSPRQEGLLPEIDVQEDYIDLG